MAVFNFDGEVAKIVGVNGAVLFWNIAYWIEKNRANKKHFHDGRYWTYNSKKAFLELFPFMTEQSVKTALNKLIDAELIMTGDYNEKGFDKTKWYALTTFGESICQKQPTDWLKSTAPLVENNQPIPDINTDNKPNSTTPLPPTVEETEFDVFWKAYPKHDAKVLARKRWEKKRPPLDVVLASIKKFKQTEQWQRDNGRYIPQASTWLNQERWKDEFEDVQPKSKSFYETL